MNPKIALRNKRAGRKNHFLLKRMNHIIVQETIDYHPKHIARAMRLFKKILRHEEASIFHDTIGRILGCPLMVESVKLNPENVEPVIYYIEEIEKNARI